MKKTTFYIIFLLSYLNIYSQTIPYDVFTTEDGLADNSTYQFVTDSAGFLWIATDNGLCKFDGTTFKTFGMADGLKSPTIVSLGLYDNSLIMECFRQGLQLFNEEKTEDLNPLDKHIGIYRSFTTYNNCTYFINHNIINKVTYYDGKQINTIKNTDNSNCLLLINDTLFVGTDDGLSFLKNNQLINYPIENLEDFRIISMAASGGRIWLGGTGEVIEIRNHKITNKIKHKDFDKKVITNLIVDDDKNLWISLFSGGLYYKKNKSVIPLLDSNIWISDIYKDKQGFIWVSTMGNGIYKFYNSFVADYSYILNQAHKTVTSINIINNDIIIAGTDETIIIHPGNEFEYINTRSFLPREFLVFGNDIVFVGQNQISITETKIQTKNYTLHYRHGTAGIKTSDTTLQIGTYGALENQTFKNGKLKININQNFDTNAISRVNAILKVNNTDWLGTTGSTYKLSDGIFEEITIPLLKNVNEITIDREGNIWFASVNGLSRLPFPYETNLLRKVHDGNFNCIKLIDNKIWAGSSKALYIIKDTSVILLDANQGIPGSNISALAFDSTTNNVWIGTDKGVCNINIDVFNKVKFLPITKILFEEISSVDSTYSITDKILFNAKNALLKVQFSALNFSIKGNSDFQYSLDDGEWVSTKDKVLLLTLSSLKYGKHTLVIRGKNPNSDWTYSDVLSFTILTPIYKSTWFFIVVSIVILAFVSLAVYYRISEVKRKEREALEFERKMNQLQNMSLSAMMNPHFIFNCLSSIQYLVNTSKTELANTYISKLARLIRMNLTDADEEEISLKREIERIELYLKLEQLRFEDRFDYEITIDDKISTEDVSIPSLIIQPLIENCIKHGIMPLNKKGFITLDIKLIDKLLLIKVIDNGVGLKDSSENHQSKGLYIIRERILLRNDDKTQTNNFSITDRINDNGNIIGTEATVTLSLITFNKLY